MKKLIRLLDYLLAMILLLLNILFVCCLYRFLPTVYLGIIAFIALLLYLFQIYALLNKKKVKKSKARIQMSFSLFVLTLLNLVLVVNINVLNKISGVNQEVTCYSFCVGKDSPIETMDALQDRTIGAIQGINKDVYSFYDEIVGTYKHEYQDEKQLFDALNQNKVDGLITTVVSDDLKELYTYWIKTPIHSNENIDVTTQSFAICLSTVDVDPVNTISSSSYNQVLIVDPIHKEITKINIQQTIDRQGIDETIQTLSKEFNIDIPFYVRISDSLIENWGWNTYLKIAQSPQSMIQTNMTENQITSLIRMQVNDLSSWNVK